jgi:hypothetical protein
VLLFPGLAHVVPLLFGGFFAAFGMLFVVVFCWGLPKDLALSAAGTETVGVVLDAGPDEKIKIDGRHPTRVRFRYVWQDVEREGNSTALDLAAEPGAAVPLTVFSPEPSWVRIKGTMIAPFGYAGLIALIFPAMGVGIMRLGWGERIRRRRAYTHGEVVVARVKGLDPGRPSMVGATSPMRVRWTFELEGKEFDGSLESSDRARIEGLVHDGRITVLYDPDHPEHNLPWVA